MTVPIAPDSPRRLAAVEFGKELTRALTCRIPGGGCKRLARAIGINVKLVTSYKCGANLPRLETAEKIAASLRWPKLEEIVRQARSSRCALPSCRRPFINEGGMPKRYHSDLCREAHVRLLAGAPTAPVRAAILQRSLRVVGDAVAAFCNDCEPEGACRTPSCALRVISPLPLERHRALVPLVRPGRFATSEGAERQREGVLRYLSERWADTPEGKARREELASRMRTWHRRQRETGGHKAWVANISKTKQEKRAAGFRPRPAPKCQPGCSCGRHRSAS